MELTFELHSKKATLAEHKAAILDLFERSYGKTLPESQWEWAYMDNPCGDPIVSLCRQEDRLVGHYAVIPISCVAEGTALTCALSMTTMVAPEARGQGLFVRQARDVYAVAEDAGCALVYGFPNANSLPGFKRHLEWRLDEQDYVAALSKKQLLSNAVSAAQPTPPRTFTIDLRNEVVRHWRLSKPGVVYECRGDCVLKPYEQGWDLLYSGVDLADALSDDEAYCALVDGAVDVFRDAFLFAYPSGRRAFNEAHSNLPLKKDMLMADVF